MMKPGIKKLSALAELYSINLWLIAFFLISSSITRLILVFLNFGEIGHAFYLIPVSLAVGIIFDLFIALCFTLPSTITLLLLPSGWRSFIVVRWVTAFAVYLFVFGSLYLGVAEIVFFDEFSSRFNYVAVDYLIYPHEVFVNIWDTFPVLTIIVISCIVALIITWLSRKVLYHNLLSYPKQFGTRLLTFLSHSMLIVLILLLLSTGFARISNNRILNEITLNGVYSFAYAGFTNELDYNQYYRTSSKDLAFQRLRQLIDDDNSVFLHDKTSGTVDRYVTSNRDHNRYNIVIVLEESFSSEFVGTLNPDGPCLTPRFDSLAEHGMLFTNVYATGNRTVRGLEASLLSFPPIPGRSIVKRPGSENIFSLPSLLHNLNYSTVFFYGGLSYFDNFKHFASTNGFDQIIDQMKFKDPLFSTIWGVSDEDLFGRSLEVFDSLATEEKPFFATIITVSNHSPYTYPKGRIPFDPEERRRENAVRYADYAIGKFIEDAKSHTFFDNTLFVFLADHGARVYGAEEIPMRSYEIPVLFYNPQLIAGGTRIDILGSQMDLAPTVLDFLGINYNSMFFGRSLLSTTDSTARVLMSHNRDVSLLKNDTLVVFGIQGDQELWHYDSSGEFQPILDSNDSPLVEDAIAYYMTAYNMFMNHQLHPLSQKHIAQQ